MTAPVSNSLSLSTSSAERPARLLPVTQGKHARRADPAEVQRLADEGYSQITAAAMLGVSRERIRQIANRDGIEFLPGGIDYDTRERVTELHGTGMADAEIAVAIGRDRQIVTSFRRTLGLPCNKSPKRSKYEAAIREMAARGMTVGEVASALGITKPYVSHIKAKFSIPFHADGRAKRFAKC